jgi:hypothetical protein
LRKKLLRIHEYGESLYDVQFTWNEQQNITANKLGRAEFYVANRPVALKVAD